MKRRDFIKKAGLAFAGVTAAPYILPSGRLFAATGARKVNHVVYVLFAGGVRNIDSIQKAEGNLMPGMLNGTETISPDLLGSMTPLPPSPLPQALQNYGTLFKEFRYAQGPTGHYNGHTTAITGQYTDNNLNLRARPDYPTVFELYRKHSAPSKNAINAWWITRSNTQVPNLNYSQYPGYGAEFGANQISPPQLFAGNVRNELINIRSFTQDEEAQNEEIKAFLNGKFGKRESGGDGITNPSTDAKRIQDFISRMYLDSMAGLHNDPWGTGTMSTDMRNIFYAEEVIKEFLPELMAVNLTGVDICHTNFSTYCDRLRKADWAVAHLWDTIQSTPGMANDTMMVIIPEIGRNGTPNAIMDENGRYALDHTTGDLTAREIFCLVAGPPSVVNQGTVISNVEGESIDVVPTIANALGFDTGAAGILPGSPLQSAFI